MRRPIWTCQKNLVLTLKTSLSGIISSATQKYRDGLTLIDESNRLEISDITQSAAPTVNNGVIVTLDEKQYLDSDRKQLYHQTGDRPGREGVHTQRKIPDRDCGRTENRVPARCIYRQNSAGCAGLEGASV